MTNGWVGLGVVVWPARAAANAAAKTAIREAVEYAREQALDQLADRLVDWLTEPGFKPNSGNWSKDPKAPLNFGDVQMSTTRIEANLDKTTRQVRFDIDHDHGAAVGSHINIEEYLNWD